MCASRHVCWIRAFVYCVYQCAFARGFNSLCPLHVSRHGDLRATVEVYIAPRIGLAQTCKRTETLKKPLKRATDQLSRRLVVCRIPSSGPQDIWQQNDATRTPSHPTMRRTMAQSTAASFGHGMRVVYRSAANRCASNFLCQLTPSQQLEPTLE